MTLVFRRCLGLAAVLSLAAGPLQAAHPTVELVSRAHPSLVSDSAFGNHGDDFAVSADGRFVAFASDSGLLVDGFVDGNGALGDVYLFDRQSNSTWLVSHAAGSPVLSGDSWSAAPALSADGRWVAFVSAARDLVPGQVDANYTSDVFLFDRLDGSTRLMSHVAGFPLVAAGAQAYSGVRVSSDGGRAAFESSSTQLVAGQLDVQSSQDVFLYDTASGENALVSHSDTLPPTAGYLDSRLTGLSADGRRVAFVTQATNLVQGLLDLNNDWDAFLFDADTTLLQPVSRGVGPLFITANAGTFEAVVSADGTRVAFNTIATNVVAGQVDGNQEPDVFLFDVASGTSSLASHVPGQPLVAGNSGSGYWWEPLALAGNGQAVAFLSRATDLVSPPVTAAYMVYLCASGPGCVLASRGTAGAPAEVRDLAGLSLDGQRVVYTSDVDVTSSGDTDLDTDVYAYDAPADATRLVSARAGTLNGVADGYSGSAKVSASGVVAFRSAAGDLAEGVVDLNGAEDLYATDLQVTSLVTRRSSGGYSLSPVGGGVLQITGLDGNCLSADGRRALFVSASPGLVPGSQPGGSPYDAFLFDRSTGVSWLASHGAAGPGQGVGLEAGRLTTDGRRVVFQSSSQAVVPGQVDTNSASDVFTNEPTSGFAALVSHADGNPLATANGQSLLRGSSADGRYVLLATRATDLVAGTVDANNGPDLYLCDRVADTCALITHAAGSVTTTANVGTSYYDPGGAVVSADGDWVAYESAATDLIAGQVGGNLLDIFLWERSTGLNTLVSHAAGSSSIPANDFSRRAVLSADGAWLAFESWATNLVAGVSDGNAAGDVYLWERATGQVTLVSHAAGQPQQAANDGSQLPSLDATGRFVAYLSDARNLVPGQVDPGYDADVFLFDRSTGENLLVSHTAASGVTAANGPSEGPLIAADGSRVAFRSWGTNLVAGQVPPQDWELNAFVFERGTGSSHLASPAVASALEGAGQLEGELCLSADGQAVAFASRATDLVAHDLNGATDVFVYGRSHVKGDLSDDLNTDLVLANRNAPVHRVWTLDGDLNRLAEVDVTPDQTGPDWQLGGVDDFDGDGQDDLVFRNASGAVEFWLMNGTARIGAPVPLNGTAPAPEWKLSATADFDHDARPDLLWRNTATRALQIWTMNGATPTGTLTPTPAQATDANWEVVAALDADRDGNTDLLWYNQTSGRIVFWFMDAAVQRLSGQFATPMQAGDANWKVLAAGDYGVGPNGRPGTYDLVWRNANSGRFVVWNMDTRGVRTAGRFVNPPAPADPLDWTIAGPR